MPSVSSKHYVRSRSLRPNEDILSGSSHTESQKFLAVDEVDEISSELKNSPRMHKQISARPLDYRKFKDLLLMIVALVFLILAVTFNYIGMRTPHWHLVYPSDVASMGYFGLLEHCGGEPIRCQKREGVFSYKNEEWPMNFGIISKDLDYILVMFLISLVFNLLGIVTTIMVLFWLCYKRYAIPRKFKYALLLISIISVAFDIAGILYFDLTDKIESNKHVSIEHGKSYHSVCGGASCLSFAAISFFISVYIS